MEKQQQRKHPVREGFTGQEIIGQRLTENTQPVEPFGRRDDEILGEFVPHQPIAADARRIKQPDGGNSADPGKPADTAIPVHDKFTEHMQQNDHHHGVRGITVKTSHNAAEIPVIDGHALDRAVGTGYAGFKKDVHINAANHDHPEKEEGQSAQMAERIPVGT